LKWRFGEAVLPLALDVTNSEQVQQVVEQAYAHFGRLDVLVNNAGTSLIAATEDASDEQIRDLFDANYLGMVRVLRSALPLLRKQRSGHILGVSSGLGITSLPLIGFYCATKWAVEAMDEALAQEVRPLGIKVTLVEPAAYATDFGKSAEIANALEPYAEFRRQFLTRLVNIERGNPEATSEAILKLVDADNPPLRLGLGNAILPRHGTRIENALRHGKRGRTSRMPRWASRRKRWRRGLSNWLMGLSNTHDVWANPFSQQARVAIAKEVVWKTRRP